MCGIVVAVDSRTERSGGELGRSLERMTATLAHRGPDDAGTWIDEEAGVGLGHRRLAVIDLSRAGAQPMESSDRSTVVTFNGEIYNHRELAADLRHRGIALRGHSDTEVLVELLAADGLERTLAALRGMFAFAAWDRRSETVVLARDRLGEKPLYHGWHGGEFLAASELKAIMAHPRFAGAIDRTSVAGFLGLGWVPGPRSILEGISKLPPGTYAQVDPSRPGVVGAPRRYWDPVAVARSALSQPISDPDDAVSALSATLSRSVERQMIADVPLGAFLSGGIDSSTVVALMQSVSHTPVRTFTIGFEEDGFDEAVQARKIAEHLGTDHTELYVTPGETLEVLDDLPDVYDEPFGDSSQIPTLLLAGLTRQSVTVALSGDGGDELFGGYSRYTRLRRWWNLRRRMPNPLARSLAGLLERPSADSWDRIIRAAWSVVPTGRSALRPSSRAPFTLAALLRSERPDTAYGMVLSHWRQPEALTGIRAPDMHRPERSTTIDDAVGWAMLTDTETYLPDDILVKVDRAAMRYGLEVRVPMLDHDVFEVAWRIAPALNGRLGESKWVLKEMLGRSVPRAMWDRPKQGFGVPIDQWLRGPLRGWAETLLDPVSLARDGLLEPAPILRAWAEHQEGDRDNAYQLWDVLMLQAWRERWRL